MSEGINEGILELARSGVISRISVMSVFESWKKHVPELRQLRKAKGLKVGLHFCLTGSRISPVSDFKKGSTLVGANGHFHPPSGLFLRSSLRRLSQGEIYRELMAQYSELRDGLGSVDHLDSHHHCHQWPAISTVVLEMAEDHNLEVRNTKIRPGQFIASPSGKAAWLSFWGAKFRKQLRSRGVPSNESFYTYLARKPVSEEGLRSCFHRHKSFGGNSQWVVHPAKDSRGIEAVDSMTDERVQEFLFLKSMAKVANRPVGVK